MAFQPERQLFSVESYHKMGEVGILASEERVELVNGEIIKVGPIRSDHASMIDLLAEEFIFALRKKAIVRVQNPVHINEYSEPEPDIVIARYQDQRYKLAHPKAEDVFLIIEVADSSLQYDREVKLPLYASAGVPEYWIINITDRQVEVYQKLVNKQYTQHQILFVGDGLKLAEPE